MINIAFEYLRKFKPVDEETEKLVMRKNHLSQAELLNCFENGIAGKYGKVYSCDPQTLFNWIKEHKRITVKGNYLAIPILNKLTKQESKNYPQTLIEWHKEVNKCFTAYLNGVSAHEFHPDVYYRMTMDDKMKVGDLKKFAPKTYPDCADNEITAAIQMAIGNYFALRRSYGDNFIYYIEQNI